VDVNGLRAVVNFPSDWRASEPPSGGLTLQLMSVAGPGQFSAVSLLPFRQVPFSLNEPRPENVLARLSQFVNTAGADVKDVGQVKVGTRYWTWVDTVSPVRSLSSPRTPSGDVVAIDPFHVWTFNTTEAGSMIQISLTVVMPKGTAPVDTEADVHAAADVFLEILKRMTFEPGTSLPGTTPTNSGAPPVGALPVGQNGVTAPVVVKQVSPAYTVDAMRAKISGVVAVQCVVETDGSVGFVRVVQSLDPGLDEEAVKAARQWQFRPGTKDGVPVRVSITIQLSFTLK